MISYFREALRALQALSTGVHTLCDLCRLHLEESGGAPRLEGRLEELERTRAKWEAELEGLMLKAEGKFNAARAAEERTRAKEKRAEELHEAVHGDPEELEDLPPEYRELLRRLDGEGGEGEGVQPMPAGLDGRSEGPRPHPRDRAKMIKWGG